MSRNTSIFLFTVAVVLLALALSGAGTHTLAAVGVEPDSVQLADALLGLAGLVPLVLLWRADQRRDRLAAERVTVILVAQDGRRLPLPWQPPRREVTTRAGLFGVLGGIAGSRRFDVGHALLNVVSSGAYDDLVEGRSNSIEIPVPDREFDEFALDAEAFQRGELRKSPPSPAPKPAKELVEIRELMTQILDHLTKPAGGTPTPPSDQPIT